MATVKIETVKLQGFRGVPGLLTVSFVGPTSNAGSTLVFGDNGSGKSSIVDAIEWVCQGRIGRSAKFRGPTAPSLINLSPNNRRCEAEVTFSDGSSVHRSVKDLSDGLRIVGDPIPVGFRRVPMSLKRSDILRFLEAPAIMRGTIFLDHTLGDTEAASLGVSLSDRQIAAQERRHAAKRSVREAAARIAAIVGVSPAPQHAESIERMIAEDVYKGVQPRDRGRVTIDRRVAAELKAITAARKEVNAATRAAKELGLDTGPGARRLEAMNALLGDVDVWLTEAFHRVTGANHVGRIEPVFGRLSKVSLELDVYLSSGALVAPKQVFSEGYEDLIALLYFLAVAQAAGDAGEAQILILDDVLQSVDASIRVAVMDLIVQEFKEWQLIITAHDRLWRNQLKDIFQRAGNPLNEIEMRHWDFSTGPQVSTSPGFAEDSLWLALNGPDPYAICGIAGRLLEQVCDQLSWTVPISVKRKRGDGYTLADTWPGVYKEFRGTTAAGRFSPVDQWLHLRNMAGAHYNEWAEGIPWSDVENFGIAVLDLLAAVRCNKCNQWITRIGPRRYVCRCLTIQIEPS
jgi:energy-coupling factor transporter ATP-binding protein EcfA2